jgi:hypothetical protein
MRNGFRLGLALVVIGSAALTARGIDFAKTPEAPAVTDPAAIGVGLAKSLDLKQQLEKALKARRPTDFAFIAQVVKQVESGRLPRKLVDQTLGYARTRSSKYPFIYFEFALKKQAEKIGVVL